MISECQTLNVTSDITQFKVDLYSTCLIHSARNNPFYKHIAQSCKVGDHFECLMSNYEIAFAIPFVKCDWKPVITYHASYSHNCIFIFFIIKVKQKYYNFVFHNTNHKQNMREWIR